MTQRDEMIRSILITGAFILLWLIGLLVIGVFFVGCTSIEYSDSAQFCGALSPVVKRMSECI